MNTRLVVVGFAALLGVSAAGARTLPPPAPEASLNTCQGQVNGAAQTYANGYVNAVGTCLQAISTQVIKKHAAASLAASTCAPQFRKIYDTRTPSKSLKVKLSAAIDKKCQPGITANVTHTLDDILGPGAGVLEPIEADNIGAWCANFNPGSSSITTLQQWIDCVAASQACDVLVAISTRYPRAVEWLTAVRPGIEALKPPATDPTKIDNALAGLDQVVAAMDPGHTGGSSFQCGNNGACDGNLATCNSNLGTCRSDLGTCSTSLGTCNTDLGACNTDLEACNAGTAAAGDVLFGQTFSSSAGLGVSGTMPSNGAVTITPGTTDQAIAAGYHNGSGKVLGDPNLVPGNIVAGVTIFGVAGARPPSQPLKTGQTQCDQGAGALGACPGSPAGQDGSLQKGLDRSYTVNGNGTITDNRTGLIWEKLDDNNASGIHDKDANFNWYNAFKKIQVLNGDATGCIGAGNPDICCTGAGTGSCSQFAGQTDWRLPNRFELESLFDLAGWSSPAVDPVFNTSCAALCTVDGAGGTTMCSCTLSGGYWTSTTSLSTTGCGGGQYCNAYDVEFNTGAIQPNKMKSSNLFYVRAVRGGL